MNEILFYYHKVNPTTWVYLSSLLMIGLFFKFSRFWSVRNLDLILLILLAPGLLLVHYGQQTRHTAYSLALKEAAEAAASPAPTDDSPTSPTPPTAAPPRETREPSTSYNPMTEIMGDLDESESSEAPPLTPAQSLARLGKLREYVGYLWLFIASGLLLVRLLLDSTMVRRPLLEPNLSPGGLAFLGIALFIFLAGFVIATPPVDTGAATANRPGYALLQRLIFVPAVTIADRALESPAAEVADPPSASENEGATQTSATAGAAVAKLVAILAQLACVIAIVGIGYRHFDNTKMGVGAATMYMMLPYTTQMLGLATHAVPAALLLWGVLFYRRPLTAGIFIGLAASVGYYPFFLLPLWLSFYWQRGLARFVIGVITMVVAMVLLLALGAPDFSSYLFDVRKMFGVLPFRMRPEDLGGIWSLGWDAVYRIPMVTAFVVLSFSFAVWPAQKNLGTLLSCSAAVMVAAQFWHGGYADPVTGLGGLDAGGLYMAWYLPLLILTIFRPNLEDRVALTVLGEGWFPRRKWAAAAMERAA